MCVSGRLYQLWPFTCMDLSVVPVFAAVFGTFSSDLIVFFPEAPPASGVIKHTHTCVCSPHACHIFLRLWSHLVKLSSC